MSIDDERTSLNNLVEIFFPLLEQIMSDISQSTSANQILIMYLIAKIFYSANNVRELSKITDVLVGCFFLFHESATEDHSLDELLPERPRNSFGTTIRDSN